MDWSSMYSITKMWQVYDDEDTFFSVSVLFIPPFFASEANYFIVK